MESYDESIRYIKSIIGSFTPQVGVILGSGLGEFVNDVEIKYSINYCDIPHFPISTVQGHDGKLIFGIINSRPIIIMKGRFHYYEGYSSQIVVYPIRIMKLLGAEKLLISNAAGGINSNYQIGDLVAITNHINFIPNPLIGKNIDEFGCRFPEMKYPYSKRIIDIAKSIMPLKEGIYIAVTGPSMETAAEINYFRIIGGDLVGMSTAPEAISAVHCGLEVFGISVVTNVTHMETSHEEVVKQGNLASSRMSELFSALIYII